MVLKKAKFGLNTGNTVRRSPILRYGRSKSSSIHKLASDTDATIEKLRECFDNSENLDPWLVDEVLKRIERVMNVIESNQEYTLDKENRGMFVNIIESELEWLKSFEDEIQGKLGGENPHFEHDPDAVFGPTDLEISLEIDNMDNTYVSKLSFSTIKATDFVSSENEQKTITVYGIQKDGIQRKDQLKRKREIAA